MVCWHPAHRDPWWDGLIGAATIVVFLSMAMGVGGALFGSAKDKAMLEEISSGQKDIIRLLKDLIDRFDAHYGPPSSTPPPPSGGDGGGNTSG